MTHIATKGYASPILLAPTAHITTNKSRKKITKANKFNSSNDSVYLKDGENFELELYNPTTSTVLAKIMLGGKAISSSGIVIKPGQRIFLDRFIDTPNKFKFETYEVNGNSSEVQKAIQFNGIVEVNFYNEKQYPQYLNSPYTYTIPNNYYYYYNTNPFVGTCTTANVTYGALQSTPSIAASLGISSAGAITFDSAITNVNNACYTTTTANAMNLTSLQSGSANQIPNDLRSTLKKTTVTGTVEKGEKSNQEFEYVNKNFENYILNSVKYIILPFENKPIKSSELKSKKNFCGVCGEVIKDKDFRFCPGCGKQL